MHRGRRDLFDLDLKRSHFVGKDFRAAFGAWKHPPKSLRSGDVPSLPQ